MHFQPATLSLTLLQQDFQIFLNEKEIRGKECKITGHPPSNDLVVYVVLVETWKGNPESIVLGLPYWDTSYRFQPVKLVLAPALPQGIVDQGYGYFHLKAADLNEEHILQQYLQSAVSLLRK